MLKSLNDLVGEVHQLIEVNPDRLIELGHKLKQMGMDSCVLGESVLAKFTDKIVFVYTPEKEFTKPIHTDGSVSLQLGSNPEGLQ